MMNITNTNFEMHCRILYTFGSHIMICNVAEDNLWLAWPDKDPTAWLREKQETSNILIKTRVKKT
jgi:hypothetical protein